MSVLRIEEYNQQDNTNILKVILKPTKQSPNGYFYCDSCDEKLVNKYSWYLQKKKKPYVEATTYNRYVLRFHREKARNILSYYPDYINHINGIEFDNINKNLDVVTNQENCWSKVSKSYYIHGRSFRSQIVVNQCLIRTYCVKTEVEACMSTYQLELKYENYRYDFLKDRRNDLDILDLERRGRISEEEAIYRHVIRYATDNAWYVYRYNLFDYFKDNHLPVPSYAVDEQGFMIHPVTGKRLCPL